MDVVFVEYQNIEDIQMGVKYVIYRKYTINLDPIPLPDNCKGNEIEDIEDA